MFSQFSIKTKIIWTILIILFGLYIIGKMSVPSYDSYRERAKIAVNKSENQQANVVSQNTNRKDNTHNPNALSYVDKRQMLASIYNQKLTDKGLAHSVFSAGDDHDTLLINKIRMSKELIDGIMSDRSFLSELKKIGFKKIEFCEPSFQGGSNCQTFQLK
jgi:hypothetical protein